MISSGLARQLVGLSGKGVLSELVKTKDSKGLRDLICSVRGDKIVLLELCVWEVKLG